MALKDLDLFDMTTTMTKKVPNKEYKKVMHLTLFFTNEFHCWTLTLPIN